MIRPPPPALLAAGLALLPILAPETRATPVSFLRDLAPVLVERCLRCHGEESAKGAYRVDTFERLLQRGDSKRPPVVPREPESSHLVALLLSKDPDERMPQKGEPLDASTLDLFRRWILEGAAFDGPDASGPLVELIAPQTFPPPPDHYAHPVPVPAITWLPGSRLAVGGFREILVWSSEGVLERRLANLPERLHALVVRASSPSSEPDLLFAGGSPGRSGAAGIRGLVPSQPTRVFHRASDTVLALACSPDGTRIAVGGTERGIALYDGQSLARVATLTGHSDWILDLAFSPDGRRLVSASRDRTARVFDLQDGSLTSVFREHKDSVTAVAFVQGGQRVVSGSREGRLRLWNADTGKALRASEALQAELQRLSVQGERLVTAWSDGKAREYRWDTLAAVRDLGTGGEPILGLATEADSLSLALSRHNGGVELLDSASGSLRRAFPATP